MHSNLVIWEQTACLLPPKNTLKGKISQKINRYLRLVAGLFVELTN